MRIDPETVERIKQAASVTEVIGDYVSVKKKGANYWACCPFHGEKTPSFSISPSKGFYKCFGCGKAGDSVRFIMDIEGLGYGEALRHLAKKYGIEIKEQELTDDQVLKQNERESLFIILDWAKNFFRQQLNESEEGQSIAKPYFKERGFSEATMEAFELGYSPEAWDILLKSALKSGFTEEIIQKAGLVTQKNDDGKMFDRFRNRVIFPIHNVSGKTIAFGARILRNDSQKNQAKYLNSPETDVYHKSSIVYGIFQAKNAIRTEDMCYLVEGYTDVISLHQAGVKNVVASSGTSLTPEQIKLIGRFSKHITVLYDGDSAGIKAALRGMDLILEEGLQVNLVVFPEGHDPDSFVRKMGSEAFTEFVKKESKDFISFQASLFLEEAGEDPFKKAEMVKEMVQSIAKIPDAIQRSLFIQKTAGMMKMDEEVLLSEMNKIHLKQYKNSVSPLPEISQQQRQELQEIIEPIAEEKKDIQDPIYYHEFECIRLLVNFGHLEISPANAPGVTLLHYMVDELEGIHFHTELFNKVFGFAKVEFHQEKNPGPSFYLQHEDQEIQTLAIDLSAEKHQLSNAWKEKHEIYVKFETEMLEDLAYKNILRLRKTHNDLQITEVLGKMASGEVSESEMNGLLEEFMNLKQIQKNISTELGTVIEK
ncbi:DNA primase [Sandaracinomonas limnophila]|uniref:DNA primase n=1 Tax=Sandaracinomonas limnophila TaxID=1862386 RepID=A0A437PR66_9BACT|nr:DNA primase [Sandaracinomonas limnophila]RVU24738.1 DNA primase [Sandaracinomonas limnophila]